MRNLPRWIATAALCCLPVTAAAHTGGPLDADGCHADHRKGTYHCHRGAAAGYTFPNRAAMQEAVRTGVFPEKTVDKEGFFSRLWPFGKKHEQVDEASEAGSGKSGSAPPGTGKSDAAPPAAGKSDAAPPATGAPAAAEGAAVPEKQREIEQKLKVLQGLYEMGLITREEYDNKRKAVLDQL